MKLTEWYSGDQKPARLGVYGRKFPGVKTAKYSWWNGRKFSGGYSSVELCERWKMSFGESKSQHLPWRGIAK
jgi:hypothetical protein